MVADQKPLIKKLIDHAAFRLPRWRGDLSRSLMRRRRRNFAALPPEKLRLPRQPVPLPGVEVYSFSCERDVPDQTLSLLSFLHHVGIPEKWHVVSDGSHTEKSERFFGALHPCVTFRSWEEFVTPLNRPVVDRLVQLTPMAKKLAVMTAMRTSPVAVYIDSDILFFPRGNEMRPLLLEKAPGHCFYMPDPYPAHSPLLRPEEVRDERGANAGFLIQGCDLDWREHLQRLYDFLHDESKMSVLTPSYLYTLDQTVVQLVLREQGAIAMGPEYRVTNDDLHNFFDSARRDHCAARHYIWDLKHHMWHHTGAYM